MNMFHTGVRSLSQSKSLVKDEEQKEDVKAPDINVTHEDDDVPNLKCFIMMLDVLLKQVGFTVVQGGSLKSKQMGGRLYLYLCACTTSHFGDRET